MRDRKGLGAPIPQAAERPTATEQPHREAAVAAAVPTPGAAKLAIDVGDASWSLVGSRLLVGRAGGGADADIELDDDSVSRRHGELVATPEGWTLRDLGSTNGTWIADRVLSAGEVARVSRGDRIRFGSVEAQCSTDP